MGRLNVVRLENYLHEVEQAQCLYYAQYDKCDGEQELDDWDAKKVPVLVDESSCCLYHADCDVYSFPETAYCYWDHSS